MRSVDRSTGGLQHDRATLLILLVNLLFWQPHAWPWPSKQEHNPHFTPASLQLLCSLDATSTNAESRLFRDCRQPWSNPGGFTAQAWPLRPAWPKHLFWSHVHVNDAGLGTCCQSSPTGESHVCRQVPPWTPPRPCLAVVA
ncbi:hypothetical protein F5883DRAFT_552851 [Diaporthe sp. PMI_573]|nr:hypothetical protein F5883DRAFT_552851 [Diaporthaceae sp. PMI_573]